MFCSQCGNRIQPESSFCSNCGAKVAIAQPEPVSTPKQNRFHLLLPLLGVGLVIVAIFVAANRDSLTSLLVARAGRSASNIAGTRWECQGPRLADKGTILEFFRDSTYTLGGIGGKWLVLDDGRIKMDFPSSGMTFFAKIEGGRLKLDLGDDKLDFVKSK